jgi:hypothetical protein
LRHLQRHAKGEVQGQGLLGMRGRLWQGREQRNTCGEMAHGFSVGRAVAGVFTRTLPVGNRVLR